LLESQQQAKYPSHLWKTAHCHHGAVASAGTGGLALLQMFLLLHIAVLLLLLLHTLLWQ
jgi:hypothetical protein